MTSQRLLLLFTKPARAGRVKTRLIGELSPTQAAQLHGAFLRDLFDRLGSGAFDLQLAWALDDGDNMPSLAIANRRMRQIEMSRQVGAGLGERLYQGLVAATERYPVAGVVGSDHPTLPVTSVERGFELLEAGAEVVLGPATDGGYYFIGVRAEALSPNLFREIPWSTEKVLEATLAKCADLGLEVALLDPGHDVDTPTDLEWLCETLERCEVGAPATASLLRSWGRLSGWSSKGVGPAATSTASNKGKRCES